MKKNKIKKILGIFLLILVSLPIFAFFGSEVRAEINPDLNEQLSTISNNMNEVFKATQSVSTGGSLFKSLTGLLGSIAFILFMGFCVAFSGFTGSVPPTPDAIIFNRVALLDVNFFNPNSYSLISMFSGDKNSGGIIAQLYNSFDTIAISLFVLCAMVVAIKMVLSSVAAQKAAAKNALKYWITGIVLLFLMRVIIAGILEFNELIVSNLSSIAGNIEFNIDVTQFAGENMGILDWIGGLFNGQTIRRGLIALGGKLTGNMVVPGYTGMLTYFSVRGWVAQDLFDVILFFVIFGQSITLLIAYGKRLMYVILLGIAAPMVVVVDTLNKITKGSSNILNSWFKEFISAVFMQSFHAVMLVVILKMIEGIVKAGGIEPALVGIICLALNTGLIKFEKFYKQLFGLQSGIVGNLKDSAGKVMVGLNAAKTGIHAIADNGTKVRNAYKARNEARQQKAEAIKSRGSIYNDSAFNNIALANELASTDSDGSLKAAYKAKEYFEKAKADGYDIPEDKYDQINRIIDTIERGGVASNGTGSTATYTYNNTNTSNNTNTHTPIGTTAAAATMAGGNANNGGVYPQGQQGQTIRQRDGIDNSVPNMEIETKTRSAENVKHANIENAVTTQLRSDETIKTQKEIAKEIQQLRREITSNNRTENNIVAKDREIAKADKQIKEANANLVSAGLATAMGPANLIAGAGIGIGASGDFLDSLKGGYVTALLDATAEKAGHAIGKAVNAQFDKHAKVDDTN